MAEPIRISALGHDAQVGDLYNYFTDVIIPSSNLTTNFQNIECEVYYNFECIISRFGGIDVPNERKTISDAVGDPKLLFHYQQPEKSKLHLLGINSHLLQNINRGSVPGHQLWFSGYLNTNSMDGDEEHAQVTLLFRVVRRTETLGLDYLRSKIEDYQIRSADASATHVIDEVVYGAELICSMRKALDLSQETKESAEVSIYFAAKKYLDETIGKSTSLELPAELDQVSCTILSSIEPGKKNEMSFDSFNIYLQNLLNTGKNRQKWKPMEFLLRNMSVALRPIEAKLWSERKDDIALEKEHHQVNIKWITEEIMDISNDPSLKRFPLLEKFICYFRDLLPPFWKGIEEAYETFEMLPEEKALEEMIYISDWLKRVMDLFACRRKDIREVCWLLKDTDLVLQDMQEIEAQMTTKDCKIAKLFVLNLEYKQVPIVNDIEELVGQQSSTAMLPVLPIFLHEKEQIGCIRSALSQFANEARLAKLSSAHGTSYYVGLESSTLENGAVKIVDYSGISPIIISEDNLVEYLQKKQKHQFPASSSSLSACLPPPLIPTAALDNQTTKRSFSRKEQIGTRAESDKTNLRFEQISLYETSVTEPSTSTEDKSNGQNQTVNRLEEAERTATVVRRTSKKCSALPGFDVYELPLKERSNAKIQGVGHYVFGEPSYLALFGKRRQKTILVLGATGSGKSTLINAMVNYILGIEWEDDFRFKLINEPTDKAQAYSQTDLVTTYDFYEMKGSRLDYSLTIVDTPGFGDTRGVEKDKKIMQQLQDYFQCPHGIQQLEAVCFVVQSFVARLTTTQEYIFDQVLSIFDENIKDNIRLMVTFADNSLPPVLAAVVEAKIPSPTDPTTGLPLHHKFNNSIFFESNKSSRQENEFNRTFFELAVNGFDKFFADLRNMEAKSLTLTREVLKERRRLEAIVEVLVNHTQINKARIDEFEQIKKKLAENQQQIDANKNFDFQVEFLVPKSTDISGTGQFTTNCQKCTTTCHFPCSQASDKNKHRCSIMDSNGTCRNCRCPWNVHFNQKFRYEMVKEKVQRSSDAIRKQYQGAKTEALTNQELLAKIQAEIDRYEKQLMELVQETSSCIQRLNEIALKPHTLSTPAYIDLMIQTEKQEHRPGYQQRITTLQRLRQVAEMMNKLVNDHQIPKIQPSASQSMQTDRQASSIFFKHFKR